MPSNNTTTTFDPALKQLYKGSNLAKTTYTRRPFLGLMPKDPGFVGRNMPIVNVFGNGAGGRSAAFATAQANYSAVKMDDFLLTRVNDYQIARVSGEVAEASVGDAGAFLSAMKAAIDGAINSLSDAIESFIPRSGTGSLGQCGSTATTTTTLKDINDVTHFEVDQLIVASVADGGALRGGTGFVTLTGINRVTGVLTAGSTWTTDITSYAADDFLYVQGDAAAAGANVKISGLAAWAPPTTVATSALFGVTRSQDSRLAGLVHPGDSQLIEEAIIDSQSKASREGGKPDTVIINNGQYRRLLKELGSKKEYSEVKAQGAAGMIANVGYTGIKIHGDSGEMDVIAANKCQSTTAWVLEKATWVLATIGEPAKFLMLDDNRMLRVSNDDAYEVRLGFRGNLGCKAPCYNVNCTLPAVT